jgi:hypothetical protein
MMRRAGGHAALVFSCLLWRRVIIRDSRQLRRILFSEIDREAHRDVAVYNGPVRSC